MNKNIVQTIAGIYNQDDELVVTVELPLDVRYSQQLIQEYFSLSNLAPMNYVVKYALFSPDACITGWYTLYDEIYNPGRVASGFYVGWVRAKERTNHMPEFLDSFPYTTQELLARTS